MDNTIRPLSQEPSRGPNPSFMDVMVDQRKTKGLAKPNRYLVLFFPNDRVRRVLAMRWAEDISRLATNCISVTMNEKSWFTSEQNDINAGATRIFPYKRNTNNTNGIRIQFYCSMDMFEKEFFDNWMSYIQDPISKRIRYYDNYARNSELVLLLLPNNVNSFGDAISAMYAGTITGYRFTEVYPYSINLNGGTLNSQNASDPMFIDVNFMYHDVVPIYDYTITKEDTGLPEVDENGYPVWMFTPEEEAARAVDGFVLPQRMRQWRARQMGIERKRSEVEASRARLDAQLRGLQEVKKSNVPKAVDGAVVTPSPLTAPIRAIGNVFADFGAGLIGLFN